MTPIPAPRSGSTDPKDNSLEHTRPFNTSMDELSTATGQESGFDLDPTALITNRLHTLEQTLARLRGRVAALEAWGQGLRSQAQAQVHEREPIRRRPSGGRSPTLILGEAAAPSQGLGMSVVEARRLRPGRGTRGFAVPDLDLDVDLYAHQEHNFDLGPLVRRTSELQTGTGYGGFPSPPSSLDSQIEDGIARTKGEVDRMKRLGEYLENSVAQAENTGRTGRIPGTLDPRPLHPGSEVRLRSHKGPEAWELGDKAFPTRWADPEHLENSDMPAANVGDRELRLYTSGECEHGEAIETLEVECARSLEELVARQTRELHEVREGLLHPHRVRSLPFVHPFLTIVTNPSPYPHTFECKNSANSGKTHIHMDWALTARFLF